MPREAHGFKPLVQITARGADKGFALLVFFRSGGFSYDHDKRVYNADAGNGLLSFFAEGAEAAAADFLRESLKRGGGIGRSGQK
jgi:hypothetical protein